MAQTRSVRRSLWAPAALTAASALLLSACSGGTSHSAGDTSGNQLLTIPREDVSTFTKNFNPFAPTPTPLTQQAIYESMLVYNPVDGKTTPWLATKWDVAKDGRSITYTLRDKVTWSDGQPLTAEDVAYTFELKKKLRGGTEYLDEVKTPDPHTAVFTFNKPFSPGLYDLGQQVIVPKHIWSKIADQAKFTNPDPVGTGPYTEVTKFQTQSFELDKNPRYWQPAKQHIAGIRVLAFAGNDAANLATISGDTDWGSQYIPNIEKSFIAKNPKNHHYFYPTTGAMIDWQMNTTKAPFDKVAVRKALSMAIDRDTITKVGMSGYTKPADCTGLAGGYDTWRDASLAASCDWTKFDADAAGKALDAAGYPKGSDGKRKLNFSISVGSESSDWLSVANVISQNLKKVGVTATVKSPAWSAVVASYEDGSFDTGIVWSNNDPTPYQFYRGMMSKAMLKPVGTQATDNYHRFSDPKADELLDEFAAAPDEAAQKAAMNKIQALYSELAPVVPLFPGPVWGEYNDSRFTGWPSQSNPYAPLTDRGTTTVLVLTTLQPVKK